MTFERVLMTGTRNSKISSTTLGRDREFSHLLSFLSLCAKFKYELCDCFWIWKNNEKWNILETWTLHLYVEEGENIPLSNKFPPQNERNISWRAAQLCPDDDNDKESFSGRLQRPPPPPRPQHNPFGLTLFAGLPTKQIVFFRVARKRPQGSGKCAKIPRENSNCLTPPSTLYYTT